jgi:hypothetical protein
MELQKHFQKTETETKGGKLDIHYGSKVHNHLCHHSVVA